MIVFLLIVILSGHARVAAFDTLAACKTARATIIERDTVSRASLCLEVMLKPTNGEKQVSK